jgi:predicted methyltransferase
MISTFPRTACILGLALALAACQQSEVPMEGAEQVSTVAGGAPAAAEPALATMDSTPGASSALMGVLTRMPEAAQARFAARHPAETLTFFGIEPGMQVLEALPSTGWYTKILVPYLGGDGLLVGVDYDKALYPLFGFMSDAQLQTKETWVDDWLAQARGWFDDAAPDELAELAAFQFGSISGDMDGSLDAALFVRALHNLARFEGQGGFLSAALADTLRVLKPGGLVGVVQHMAPESAPDDWADGSAGYLKKSFVIAQFEAAGFELVAESDVNENPLDQPTVDDVVWRLPPTLMGSADNPELAAARTAIGESSRMTLLFKKPAS